MAVKSPCIDVCVLDPERDECIGCFRSRAEIAAWRDMSDGEKRRVLARLPARRARYLEERQAHASTGSA